MNLLLNECNIPKVKESDKVKLEGHITYSEMLYCLKNHQIIQALDLTVLRMIFLKFFWRDVGRSFLRAINGCFSKGELSESLKRGVITCFPKENKEKLY